MTVKAGVASRIAIGDATTAMTLISFDSESLQETRGVIVNNGIRGTRAHYIERVRNGDIAVGGNLTFTPQSNEWAYLLPKILGGTPSGTTYPLAETLSGFILDKEYASGDVHRFPALYVNQATISGSAGSAITLSLDLLGTGSITTGATFASGGALTDNTANDFFVHSDSDGAFILGGSTIPLNSFEIVINNAIELRKVNSRTATAATATDRLITVNFSVPYGDATFSTFTDADVTGSLTLSALAQSLGISFAGIRFNQASPTIGGRGETLYSLPGQAMRTSSAGEVSVTLDSTP